MDLLVYLDTRFLKLFYMILPYFSVIIKVVFEKTKSLLLYWNILARF